MKREAFNSRSINIPSFVFQDRRLSAFEAVVQYLKEDQKLSLAQIAELLNRDARTIWTVYDRVKKKRDAT